MALLTDTDLAWLRRAYPDLHPNGDGTEVRGVLGFTAAYDAATNGFSIIRSPGDTPPGLTLSGSYDVLIKDIADMQAKRWLFPRLYIQDEGFPFSPARHCTVGKSGCLCGSSEEVALLRQGYLFPKFLEELCVPFLYAQAYYDRDGHWPWPDYDHDILGVLQSYLVSGSLESLEFTLWWSLNGGATWPWIRAILRSKKRPQGHMPCFCEKGAPIRNCHPEAWEGLKKLYADVHASGRELPPLEQGGRA